MGDKVVQTLLLEWGFPDEVTIFEGKFVLTDHLLKKKTFSNEHRSCLNINADDELNKCYFLILNW